MSRDALLSALHTTDRIQGKQERDGGRERYRNYQILAQIWPCVVMLSRVSETTVDNL